ncbi:copper-binding protein [Bradyrhizobium sp. CIAT3101]|uniref:copper-binding protein n=1 Tax=Bradyrhizobium sp. CIAT3101 TaxID=439387 RepID=UPI0032C2424B
MKQRKSNEDRESRQRTGFNCVLYGAWAQSDAISGEIKNIDEAAGKVTSKHGPAKSLGMDEPMTMVYRVKHPAVLKQIKVEFEAENGDSGYTVTKLQKK